MSILCEADNLHIDQHGNEHEEFCTTEAVAHCCNTLWCETHHVEHVAEDHNCDWCKGTGIYSGPMLNSHYAGPCLMCS